VTSTLLGVVSTRLNYFLGHLEKDLYFVKYIILRGHKKVYLFFLLATHAYIICQFPTLLLSNDSQFSKLFGETLLTPPKIWLLLQIPLQCSKPLTLVYQTSFFSHFTPSIQKILRNSNFILDSKTIPFPKRRVVSG
jgi:hypothetical protein